MGIDLRWEQAGEPVHGEGEGALRGPDKLCGTHCMLAVSAGFVDLPSSQHAGLEFPSNLVQLCELSREGSRRRIQPKLLQCSARGGPRVGLGDRTDGRTSKQNDKGAAGKDEVCVTCSGQHE